MKKLKNISINNLEEKKIILHQDKYFSKAIKYIDGKLTFNKSIKKIKLNNSDKKLSFKNFHNIIPKNLKIQKKEQNTKIIPIKRINKNTNEDYNNTYRDENFRLNKLSRIKRLSYLPQISPYIYNNNTSISIDYNKANEMGARGFKILCNNESDSIKEILFAYNDYNYNNIYDYNTCVYFNNINDNLKNNNDKGGTNKTNENEKNKNFESHETKNIFDKNYTRMKKLSKINKLLTNKIERIKTQNKKVYKVLGQYKKKFFNNHKADNRIYKLNYNAIEKHIPSTILNSKTQRTIPENYTNKNNFKSTSYDNFKIKENKLFSQRLKTNKIIKSLSFKKLCSDNSLNNSEKYTDFIKLNNTVNNLKNIFVTKQNNILQNDNKKYLSQRQNKEEITNSNIFNYLDDCS